MLIYTIYVKTHRITGLKYLGQTKRKNVLDYTGSGVAWSKHLEKFGKNIHTEILIQTTNWDELKYWGKYYSKLYNVVSAMDDFGNKIYANAIPETGGGGGRVSETYTKEERQFRSSRVLGDKNPMKLQDVVKKKSGNNHHMKKLDYTPSNHPMKREEVRAKISGPNHIRYDHKIYKLYNTITNQTVFMTQREFIKEYKLDQGSVSRLIRGKYKKLCGWELQMPQI